MMWCKGKTESARIREDALEREKIARLEMAEKDLKSLQARGDRAIQMLTERHGRNHWREAIEQMIQGAS